MPYDTLGPATVNLSNGNLVLSVEGPTLIRGRLTELLSQRNGLAVELAAAEAATLRQQQQGSSHELLSELPLIDADALRQAPEDLLRSLFDAFHLEIRYDPVKREALWRVVVNDDSLPVVDGLSGTFGAHGGRLSLVRTATYPRNADSRRRPTALALPFWLAPSAGERTHTNGAVNAAAR